MKNYDVSYLQIPIYYSASILRFEDNSELLAIQLGPFISRVLTVDNSEANNFSIHDASSSMAVRQIEDYINYYDYGISLGIQLFHNKNHNIFFRFVFDISISPFFREEFVPGSGDSKNTLKSFILFFGIET